MTNDQASSNCRSQVETAVALVGVSPSVLGEEPKSSSDEGIASAAMHAKNLRHLRNHELRTLPRSTGVADRAMASARAQRKS